MNAIAWKYYAVYIVILSFYAALIFTVFPETKKLTAEQAAQVFDQGRHGKKEAAVEAGITREDVSATEEDDVKEQGIHGGKVGCGKGVN